MGGGCLEVRQRAQVDETRLDAQGAHDGSEDPVRPSVYVVAAHDVIAGAQRIEEWRGRGGPAGDGEPVRPALERGEAGLQRRARGIAAARVVEATGLAGLG